MSTSIIRKMDMLIQVGDFHNKLPITLNFLNIYWNKQVGDFGLTGFMTLSELIKGHILGNLMLDARTISFYNGYRYMKTAVFSLKRLNRNYRGQIQEIISLGRV